MSYRKIKNQVKTISVLAQIIWFHRLFSFRTKAPVSMIDPLSTMNVVSGNNNIAILIDNSLNAGFAVTIENERNKTPTNEGKIKPSL